MRRATTALFGLLPVLACAPKGTRPHDMSEARHEAEATKEEQGAEAHAELYDPNARVAETRCGAGWSSHGYPICWTSVRNPTEAHRRALARALEVAAAHREASAALATAEDQACRGLAPADRDMSPFEHTEDIASVEPHWRTRGGKAGRSYVDGATITFLAVPGMTAEWLQREVDCHLARAAALGHDVPEMPDCPLVPNGAQAQVASTGNGFAVTVRADNEEAGGEILARARRLLPAPAGTK